MLGYQLHHNNRVATELGTEMFPPTLPTMVEPHCQLWAHLYRLTLSHTCDCTCKTGIQTPEYNLQLCPLLLRSLRPALATGRLHWKTNFGPKVWSPKDCIIYPDNKYRQLRHGMQAKMELTQKSGTITIWQSFNFCILQEVKKTPQVDYHQRQQPQLI